MGDMQHPCLTPLPILTLPLTDEENLVKPQLGDRLLE